MFRNAFAFDPLAAPRPAAHCHHRGRARLAAGRRRLAEIGVLQGTGTRLLREHMAPDGVLFAIDPLFRNRLGVCYNRWLARRHAAR